MMASRLAIRSVLVGAGLWFAGLGGGCVHAPRQSTGPVAASPSPTPPPSPGEVTPTVAVDLNRTVGENTTFHKTATDRQRFQVHLDFGKVFEAQGNLDRALQEYQDALKVTENRGQERFSAADKALAHRRIASSFDRLGQFAQAEAHYKKAEKLAPKDPKVWNDLGYSYYLQGRWDEAERTLRKALKLAPDDARVRTNLGLTLAAAGKIEDARPLLSRNEGDAIGHANLGYLLAATGQYERARQEYQTALSMRPDLTLARQALMQLDRQERGIIPAPKTLMANNPRRGSSSDGTIRGATPVDAAVTPASASTTVAIPPSSLPPLPLAPMPKLPSRSLP
jgi:tetratricopeptide (TPR) repeat protein